MSCRSLVHQREKGLGFVWFSLLLFLLFLTMTSSVSLTVYFLILLSQGLMPFWPGISASSSRPYSCRSYQPRHERVVREPRNFESRLLSRASESSMTLIKAPSPAPLGLASVSCFGQESRCSSCSSRCDAEGSFPVIKGNQ